jgi:mannose-6-phosphate isomerase-like protein (cupin superfamily)
MADFTVKRIDDMTATFGGGFRLARAELGVTAWGMQILDLPPNLTEGYPDHDHSETGQEEVFVTLRGSGTMTIEGEEVELTPDVLVRVGPNDKRCIRTGPDGARILALGGVPGAAYEVNPRTELDAAQP